MQQQKGFSLVEVLVSLLIMTTLVLSLIQQQWQAEQLLNQLILREQDAQFDETLWIHALIFPSISSPYRIKAVGLS